MSNYPLHPGQTSPEPYYVTVPLEEYEGLKDRLLQMQNKVLQLEGEKILLEHKLKECLEQLDNNPGRQ